MKYNQKGICSSSEFKNHFSYLTKELIYMKDSPKYFFQIKFVEGSKHPWFFLTLFSSLLNTAVSINSRITEFDKEYQLQTHLIQCLQTVM